jgi:hypothetical protein
MNNPATLADMQQQLHTLYESNVSQPVFGDLDYTVRTGYLNAAIHKWESLDGVLWNELYATNSATATDGTTTVFTLPTNLNHLTGNVQVLIPSGTYIDYQTIPEQEAHKHRAADTQTYAFVTGTPGAYSINFTQAPPVGTLVIPYYKHATELSAASDVTEVPDPYYLIYSALADLQLYASNYYAYNAAGQQAEAALQSMKVRNESLPYYQPNAVPNLTAYGWGE